MKNIRMERPSKKLDYKNIGLFKIKKLVESSYQLELPHTMKIYNIFYSNLLCKTATDPLLGQQNSPPPPTVVDNILDAKQDRGGKKILFRVKWKGYDDNKVWYDAANFDHAQDVVDNFYKQNLTKP